MFASIRLGMLLVLVAFGRPRTTGRHSATRAVGNDGFDLAAASGALLEVAPMPHEKLVYVSIRGEDGAAIAGLRPDEARRLGNALLAA